MATIPMIEIPIQIVLNCEEMPTEEEMDEKWEALAELHEEETGTYALQQMTRDYLKWYMSKVFNLIGGCRRSTNAGNDVSGRDLPDGNENG